MKKILLLLMFSICFYTQSVFAELYQNSECDVQMYIPDEWVNSPKNEPTMLLSKCLLSNEVHENGYYKSASFRFFVSPSKFPGDNLTINDLTQEQQYEVLSTMTRLAQEELSSTDINFTGIEYLGNNAFLSVRSYNANRQQSYILMLTLFKGKFYHFWFKGFDSSTKGESDFLDMLASVSPIN